MSSPDSVTILLVEDDPGHARLIEKNLRRGRITNELVIIRDGKEAEEYLFGEGRYEGFQRPSQLLVLLDLNLPVRDGFQILQRLKSDDRTKLIPVVVVTSTDDNREVLRCYELGCNVFITKPVDYQKFCEAIKNLGLFLSVVSWPVGA
ncbi:MAG: response regulator [Desulfomonilaceae bacterium]